MKPEFSARKLSENCISPYDQYCIGYPNRGSYIISLVIGIGVCRETYSHSGSDTLDSIIAYDRAEIEEAYMGQINMSIVSSFCGPEGLIWGYDMARCDLDDIDFSNKCDFRGLKGVRVKDGQRLRESSRALLGAKNKRNFPFLPGSHVYCAGKFCFFRGPTHLYSAVAIGIPQHREKDACLIMEDVGQFFGVDNASIDINIKPKVVLNIVKSVLEVAKNHNTKYDEIIVDFVSRGIEPGEIGCALVSAPYFHLAKYAYDSYIADLTLDEWVQKKKEFFIDPEYRQ